MKKIVIRLMILVVIAGAIWGGYRLFEAMPHRQEQIATTKVRKSDVVVRSYARGELRAVRSATLIAPNLFGTVQVTRLAPLGALAREKDLIVEFDDAEVVSRIEEKQLELDQVDEQIKKAEADLAVRNNQDDVELLRARYSVRRAELEVKRNELLPQIDQQKNLLNLKEANQRLKQLESDIKSRRQQAEAELAVLAEQKRKAQMEMGRERQRLSQVKVLSPISGLVAIRQNRTGMFFPGMQIPDIRDGDQVQPGIPIADILDLSELEVVAKIGELDRANLKEGQEVLIKLDAMGDQTFHGRIKSMSGTASANIFSGDPAKKFDVVFSVDMKELLSELGAKPEQIRKVLAAAAVNRKKGPLPSMTLGGGGGGGMMVAPGGGGAGAAPGGAPGGAPATAMGGAPAGPMAGAPETDASGGPVRRNGMFGGGGGGGPRGAFGNLSEEDRGKMRQAMQKALNGRQMQDLSPEDRQKVMAEVRKAVPALANLPRPNRGAAPTAEGEAPAGVSMPRTGGSQFSDRDFQNAQLPPPIDPATQFDVLLRPGLLADVEIILENFPNAIHIPNQAVFERDGKPIVYVRKGSAWEERVIQPLKRSESVVVVASGLEPGETIAMADPTAKRGDKKQEKGGGGPVGNLPGGGGRSRT
jgi:multidrug resistance efflux pump